MLPKYLRKLMAGLPLNPSHNEFLQSKLPKIEESSGKDIIQYNVQVCKLLLKISEELL